MTPQQLKNAILQQAIQGKLVEQRAEEGTGQELFEVIQDEKKKLIEEGKLKKQKALPDITEEEIPFEIPETWKWVKLIDLVSILGDGIHGTPKYSASGDYYFINGNNLNDGKIELKDTTKRVDKQEWEKYKKNLDLHTILISINGTIGNIAFYNNEKIMLGKSACYFNVVLAELKNYLFFLLKSDYFLKYALHSATGTTIKNVSLKAMSNLLIPLPPLDEQQRIVEKIEELLPLVERYEKAWIRLEALNKKFPLDMKKAILGQAIQGKLAEQRVEEGTGEELFETIQEEKQKLIEEGKLKKQKALPDITEEEIPFEIPESWKWVRLGDLAKVTGGYAFKSNEFTEQGVRVIRISDFNENGFVNSKIVRHSYDDILQMFLIEKKNILLCMTGGTVGKSLFVRDLEEPMMTNQRVATIKIHHNLFPEYINYNVLSPIVQKTILLSKNSTNDNISMDTIKSFLIPLPPLAEQKRIVEKIEELLPLVEKLK